MHETSSLDQLLTVLQAAYSGELAAAHAYRGHWRSLSDNAQRARIKQIEDEEWHHRNLVGGILQNLGARPDPAREARAHVVGRVLGALCHVAGWFAPMYGAGKLESRNIREYEAAARYAAEAGHPEHVDCLLTMAEVEWEHEAFFRSQVLSHKGSRILKVWPAPAPKADIRASFVTFESSLRSLPQVPVPVIASTFLEGHVPRADGT